MRADFFRKFAAALPFLLAAVSGAQTAPISIALVPKVVQDGTSSPKPAHAFVIESIGNSNRTATLTFDLTAIPRGVQVSAVLRVITVDHPTGTQQVRVFPDRSSGPSLAQISINKNSPSAAESTGDDPVPSNQLCAFEPALLCERCRSREPPAPDRLLAGYEPPRDAQRTRTALPRRSQRCDALAV
jgi:hypothetical protein